MGQEMSLGTGGFGTGMSGGVVCSVCGFEEEVSFCLKEKRAEICP